MLFRDHNFLMDILSLIVIEIITNHFRGIAAGSSQKMRGMASKITTQLRIFTFLKYALKVKGYIVSQALKKLHHVALSHPGCFTIQPDIQLNSSIFWIDRQSIPPWTVLDLVVHACSYYCWFSIYRLNWSGRSFLYSGSYRLAQIIQLASGCNFIQNCKN